MDDIRGETLLELRGVGKTYGATTALDLINIRVRSNELVGLIGPNGAGKTTILEIAEGVSEPTSGTVAVFGESPGKLSPAAKSRIGLVFQRYALPGYVTVRHLISIFRSMLDCADAADTLVVKLGLAHLLEQKIGTLSAGQQQRLAVYVALIGSRELILLDEPTSALDLRSREAVWDALLERKRRGALGGLLATHNMAEAALLCDRLCFLRDGQICAQGPTSQFMGGSGGNVLVLKFSAPKHFVDSWQLSSDDEFELAALSDHYELICPRPRLPHALGQILEAESRMDFNANLSLSERGLEKTYMEIFGGHG